VGEFVARAGARGFTIRELCERMQERILPSERK
jgi:hypothetical protein